MVRSVALLCLFFLPTLANAACLTDCTPRIGIVSAFGAEADILVINTQKRREHLLNGNRFVTGLLEGNPIVIVLSGVGMINASMITQLMVDHFRVERLVMSGIAGGVAPSHHVGDVFVPERWAMPMEIYWSADNRVPSPCGQKGDMSCLGLQLARDASGQPLKDFHGEFMRENYVLRSDSAPRGEFRFDYGADPRMLAVARSLKPALLRCGPARPDVCVDHMPQLVVGGRSVSGTAFLANAEYRRHLFDTLQAGAVDMETAALAHVAHANRLPFVAFRSLSDLAGGDHSREVGAFFGSGLAEANASAVTLAFLRAWKVQASAVTSTAGVTGKRKLRVLKVSTKPEKVGLTKSARRCDGIRGMRSKGSMRQDVTDRIRDASAFDAMCAPGREAESQ